MKKIFYMIIFLFSCTSVYSCLEFLACCVCGLGFLADASRESKKQRIEDFKRSIISFVTLEAKLRSNEIIYLDLDSITELKKRINSIFTEHNMGLPSWSQKSFNSINNFVDTINDSCRAHGMPLLCVKTCPSGYQRIGFE